MRRGRAQTGGAGAEAMVTVPNRPLLREAPKPPPEPPEEDNSDRVTIVAVIFVVLLTLGAIWVFKSLQFHNDVENCIASGRRNCIDILHPDAPPP